MAIPKSSKIMYFKLKSLALQECDRILNDVSEAEGVLKHIHLPSWYVKALSQPVGKKGPFPRAEGTVQPQALLCFPHPSRDNHAVLLTKFYVPVTKRMYRMKIWVAVPGPQFFLAGTTISHLKIQDAKPALVMPGVGGVHLGTHTLYTCTQHRGCSEGLTPSEKATELFREPNPSFEAL